MPPRQSTPRSHTRRFSPLGQVGLRTRMTFAFALGSLLVALVLSLTSIWFIRRNLLEQREALVSERAEVNASLVADKIGKSDGDLQSMFGSLSTAGKPSVLLADRSGGDTDVAFSVDTRYGAQTLPPALTERVRRERRPAVMRYDRDGETLLAVGFPLPDVDGAYFEVNQLDDISRSLGSLRITLISAAIVAAAVGAAVGWWASRRVLRPLADISNVATDVAQGKLDARLAYSEWADDPDLAPLVSSFNEMVAALQDRIDRDARFASDVSHELRSPLTTFNASVEVLRNARDDLPERAQLALDLLESDLERFTQLVEDLLEISRFDAGAVRLELDEVRIVETVRQAVRALSSADIPVLAPLELEPLIIRCDKRRLVRVLANFLDNAAKYADGATAVLVERVPEPVDEEGDAGDDPDAPTERMRVIVEDRGPGIPEGERARIFDRFSRGDQGGSRGSDLGVGLGLALAAEHARLQGGSVWVEDRADGDSGARFVIDLPLIAPDNAASALLGEDAEEPGLDEVTSEHVAVRVDSEGAPL